jgi:hypothetical protein
MENLTICDTCYVKSPEKRCNSCKIDTQIRRVLVDSTWIFIKEDEDDKSHSRTEKR